MSKAGSRALNIALFAVVLLGALAAVSWRTGWIALGSDSPPAVIQVPSRLPTHGVQLEDGAIVLTPWAKAPRGAMSAAQAVAAARAVSSHRALPVTVLKVELTTPNVGLPGTFGYPPSSTIDHVPVWLVTYTSPKPIDASGGGLLPFYVTQFSEAVDAASGKFVFGFETPFPCRHANPGSGLDACEHGGTVHWESKRFLGNGKPEILRTETIRDLGGNPEVVDTVHGKFKLPPGWNVPGASTASYAWLDVGDQAGFRLTTASQLAAISHAQRATALFSIFPDFTSPTILCAIPTRDSSQTIAGACSTTFIAPRTIRFQERWPVNVPAQTHPKRSGWIVALGRSGGVQSIRQFGDLPPQLAK